MLSLSITFLPDCAERTNLLCQTSLKILIELSKKCRWPLVIPVLDSPEQIEAMFPKLDASQIAGIRVRQISRAIGARFDERLAERTRMARDLHDTFLQTIQGSKLVVDHALKPSADPSGMRGALEQLSVWLERATQEGRTALNSLRTATAQTNDLAEALRRVTKDDLIPSSMAVTFSVVGDASEMHPIVRDEIYRIGYEAIRNACMHSGASQLDVELRYAHDLVLRVSDNGMGIDPAIADEGKGGHFGLQGMRERAARIAGNLTLGSSSNSGTEIKLVVPGDIVFRKVTAVHRTLSTRIKALLKRMGRGN
jgi:signal transduction histidine kinase